MLCDILPLSPSLWVKETEREASFSRLRSFDGFQEKKRTKHMFLNKMSIL